MKYINRIDRRKAHGWNVRIHALKGNRFFSDSKHGGRNGALDAAVGHRDKRLREAGIPLTARAVVTGQRRGTTGVPGVSLYRRRNVCYYVVSFAAEVGRKSRKMFRVGDGEEARKATLKLAVAFRREQEKAIYGGVINANYRRALAEVCQ